jgi:mercuric ion transport protein
MQYHSGMTQIRMLTVGLVGALAAAICCFSPILAGLLGAVGLSALTGYLDYVLLPAIVIFAALVIYALARRKAA